MATTGMPNRTRVAAADGGGAWIEMQNEAGPGWSVTARIVETEEGGSQIAELRIHPNRQPQSLAMRQGTDYEPGHWEPTSPLVGGGLSARHLREHLSIRHIRAVWSEWIQQSREFRERVESREDGTYDANRVPRPDLHDIPLRRTGIEVEKPRPGRPLRHDADYLYVAQDYATQTQKADPRPVETLAKHYGLSVSYVGDLIRDARKRGLITKSPGQGIAGGQLTDRAKDLIERHGG